MSQCNKLSDDSLALVPLNPIEKKKHRKDLKQRAKKHVVETLGKNPFADQNTFVTGGGLPGKQRLPDENSQSEDGSESDPHYDEDPED